MKGKNIKYNSVDEEIMSKGKDVIKDFNDAEGFFVTPKLVENKLISIRLPRAMIRALRMVARMKGDIGYQQIIKTYISEGLLRESRRSEDNVQSNLCYGYNTMSGSVWENFETRGDQLHPIEGGSICK